MLSRQQRDLVKNKNFLYMWFGLLLSSTAGWFILLAANVLVFEVTQSGLAVSKVWILYTIPSIVLSPLVGVFVDNHRSSRRLVMVISNAGCAMILFILFFFWRNIVAIYLMIFLVFSLRVLFSGAHLSFFPLVVGNDNLLTANFLQSSLGNVSMILGPILAGATIRVFGSEVAFLVAGIGYLFSGTLIHSIATAKHSNPEDEREKLVSGTFAEALSYILREKVIRVLLVMSVVSMLGFGALSALLVVYAKDALNAGAGGYGALLSADALGGIIGGVLLSFFAGLIRAKGVAIALGGTVVSVTTFALAHVSSLSWAIAILVCEGLFITLGNANQETLLQETVPEAYRGRVFMGFQKIVSIATVLSMAIAGAMHDLIGIRNVFLVSSALAATAATIGWWKLREV